jgi:tetratricopeptide (TPR) repeat protein
MDTGRPDEERAAVGRSPSPTPRHASVPLLLAALLFLALPTLGTAQAPRRAAVRPVQDLTRALNEGRYDEVATLAEKLDARDPNVVAAKARALIARGKYAEADALLRPVAGRAPTSEAALELGMLQRMLGRAEGNATLQKLVPLADTSTDAFELARAARALRALGAFQDANAAYRDAISVAPNDPIINAAWGDLFREKFQNAEALKSYQLAL